MRVIIVGSGIAGAGVAYQLVRGGAEVILVDAGLTAAATSAGAGIVSPWTTRRGEDEFRLAAAAAGDYPRLVAELAEDGEPDSSFQVAGAMVVSADDRELDQVQRRIADRIIGRPAAGTLSRLDPAQARELFPALAPGLAAVHVSGGARVDGRLLRAALLRAAARRGVRLVESRAELTRAAGVTGVRTERENFAADRMVVAAGAWSTELLAPLGVRVPVSPQRGQISHFELPGTDTASWPVLEPGSGHYLLAFPGSRVVAGATRETGSGFDARVTAAGQHEVLERALAVAPGLAEATLLETRVGFRPASADGLPLLGPLAGLPEVLLATGFGAAGLTLAPYCGRALAALILGGTPEVELSAYRPERDSAG